MIKENTIQIPSTLSSISFTRDNGLRIGFMTQELSDENKLIVQKFYQKFGYLLFSSNEFQDGDIPKEKAEKQSKTPSQRLRATLFVLYQQTKSEQDFEMFYKQKMEKLIDMVKSKLDKV